ncbi:hypothetical protein SNEBB_000406 [Seison nebaliae]|nr:hypothetical protein SNEBB_000406 [Seison nebaliae]
MSCPIKESESQLSKLIKDEQDISKWIQSETYGYIMKFITILCDNVRGKKLTDQISCESKINGLLHVFCELEKYIKDNPPIQSPQRFGNIIFKKWYEKTKETAQDLLEKHLVYNENITSNDKREISIYFCESFGNPIRIDYGTGHELNFLIFLFSLYKLGLYNENDFSFVVLKIFNSYLRVVRDLQMTYRMEPAGSHGVWSLDDYQFLPFMFGAAQYSYDDCVVESSAMLKNREIMGLYEENLFFGAIKYLNEVKSGLFQEHSPILYSLSQNMPWGSMVKGLKRMYEGEVLKKFPVVQHFLFGNIIKFE